MGYYANFNCEICKNTKVDINKFIETKDKGFYKANESFDYGWEDLIFEIDKDHNLKNISVTYFFAKFYDDDKVVNFLKYAIKSGELSLYFEGEDGASWGYKITPEKVENLSKKWEIEGETIEVYQLTDEWLNDNCNVVETGTMKQLKNWAEDRFADLGKDWGYYEDFKDKDMQDQTVFEEFIKADGCELKHFLTIHKDEV